MVCDVCIGEERHIAVHVAGVEQLAVARQKVLYLTAIICFVGHAPPSGVRGPHDIPASGFPPRRRTRLVPPPRATRRGRVVRRADERGRPAGQRPGEQVMSQVRTRRPQGARTEKGSAAHARRGAGRRPHDGHRRSVLHEGAGRRRRRRGQGGTADRRPAAPRGVRARLFEFLNTSKRSVHGEADELVAAADLLVAGQRRWTSTALWAANPALRRGDHHPVRLRRSVGAAPEHRIHPAGGLRLDRAARACPNSRRWPPAAGSVSG